MKITPLFSMVSPENEYKTTASILVLLESYSWRCRFVCVSLVLGTCLGPFD